jgi:hypothetical protein
MDDRSVREHLVDLLRGGGAHVTFEDAVADLAPEARGRRPAGLPYSAWEQLEHLRLVQWDILEFSRSEGHESPPWPEGYWPGDPAPPDDGAWERSVQAFHRDNRQMQGLVLDPQRDLLAPFPWGDGQTLLREALLAADHNAYHLGQLLVIRRLLGVWG